MEWAALIAVATIFGIDTNKIISILKGDESMYEKIEKLKGLILDNITELVQNKNLSVDDYSKIASMLSTLAYDPKSLLEFSCANLDKREG